MVDTCTVDGEYDEMPLVLKESIPSAANRTTSSGF